MFFIILFFFFFKQKTAYEITYGDWSSDVCSSDLVPGSPGRLSVETIYLSCLGATVDTVDVDVRVESSPQAIDAAGVDIAFNATLLAYAGYRRGDLTQAWPFFDAVLNGNAVRVGGFTS